MNRYELIESLPSVPVLPIILLCNTDEDVDQVTQMVAETHGKRYLTQYDVRIVLNTQDNRDMMRSTLCLPYIDTSCMVIRNVA